MRRHRPSPQRRAVEISSYWAHTRQSSSSIHFSCIIILHMVVKDLKAEISDVSWRYISCLGCNGGSLLLLLLFHILFMLLMMFSVNLKRTINYRFLIQKKHNPVSFLSCFFYCTAQDTFFPQSVQTVIGVCAEPTASVGH